MTPLHLRNAFVSQAKSCTHLGSPFMGRLCTLFATRLWPASPLRDRIFNWSGNITSSGHSVPLRIAGALHALRLNGDAQLTAAYPPNQTDDDTLWDAFTAAFIQHAEFIDNWINSPPQTNEVRRSAVLIAIGHWLADKYKLPLKLSELGASGGLNQSWDRFALDVSGKVYGPSAPALTLTPVWRGPTPPVTRPRIIQRAGVDLNPLNPAVPADSLRLRAYLWPDQHDRLEMTEAAMSVASGTIDKGDAVEWLATRLSHEAGQLHLVYHTVAWQYFPDASQEHGRKIIEAAGAQATDSTPLAWFSMEAGAKGPGATMTLRLWPGDQTIEFGHVDFHGRWVEWSPPC